jgi:DNA-binding YbaB/EbfC family protein
MNLESLFGKIQEVQDSMSKVRDQLNDITVEADAGGGMVKVLANANKRVLKITLDPEALIDREMLEDLLCAAINKALERAEEEGRQHLQKSTLSILPNIPGLDPNMFKI